MIPDLGFNAHASIEIGVPEDTEPNDRAWKIWKAPRIQRPSFSLSVIVGTSAVQVGLGPQLGRAWTVKRVSAQLGTPVGAAVPAAAQYYLFADAGGTFAPATLNAMQLLWEWTTLPILSVYAQHQVTIVFPEKLVFVANAAAVYTVAGQIQVLDEPVNIEQFSTLGE